MSQRQWRSFFEHEAHRYLDNAFTGNTRAEVDFIVRELGLQPGQSILDVGCGTGRHSLELARRGYRCTGVDQSPEMLRIGQRIAREEGLEVEFILGEASTTGLEKRFDHAICLCEGAFSLLEQGMDPVQHHVGILRNIQAMVKPGGMFLLTALNGFRSARSHSDEDVTSGRFDIMSLSYTEELATAGGATVTVVEKGFMPSELTGLLETAGFSVLSLWGGTAGSWNKQPLRLDEIELMVLARRR